MADEGLNLDDGELARRLRAFGQQRQYPPTPDLAPIVQAHIEARSRPAWVGPSRTRRLATIGAALIVLLSAAALVFPATRSAVAGWLQMPGITFSTTPDDERPALGGTLRLGAPVTLDEAQAGVGYRVLVPELAWIGEPDEVYLDAQPTGGAVSLIYHASDNLPAAETTGVGLLLSQFQGKLNPGMYGKGLPDGVQLETIQINGRAAYWISGTPHSFSYIDPDETFVQETIRLAGNTLLWQDGDLTLRLESSLDRERAVEIAESMR